MADQFAPAPLPVAVDADGDRGDHRGGAPSIDLEVLLDGCLRGVAAGASSPAFNGVADAPK
ncbi:hypothetical protein [Mycobacterium noviomagense]|uniref:hypothetical protein n=1 Tax=Mycobacterium noviomagense TaxID=459858 RepID=UPI00111C1BD7|nr:hypothetical protein [Mycobacterium noviomagense]